LIFGLVTFSLGNGMLPRLHPSWAPETIWIVAVTAALLFFVSILLHELSHALVGRSQGMSVDAITLFVFGGVAHLRGEPRSPKAELLMAIVGPITSIAIGIGATLVGAFLAAGSGAIGDAEAIAASMGPLATVFLWLGPINLLLGVFNLVPGFPLDGGRVLRAALWWATGDMLVATRWASRVGRGFAVLLITVGILMAFGFRIPFFGTGFFGGMWLVLIGWFLHNAARASFEQLLVRHHLAGVPVTDIMRARIATVPPELSVARLVGEYLLGSDQPTFPVVDGSRLLGMVSARHVRSVPRERWQSVTVGEVMTPREKEALVDARAYADEALEKLAATEEEALPVAEHEVLRGMVDRRDILRWLTLQPQPT
jgi:Zn-dependent protease